MPGASTAFDSRQTNRQLSKTLLLLTGQAVKVMTNAGSGLLAFVGLLLANGFFVAAEFAVISARRAQLEPRADAGSRPAKITVRAMDQVALILATAQIGVTICGLLILLVVEPSVHELLSTPLALTPLSTGERDGVAFAVTLVFVSFLHVLIGEMVPKNISFSIPERAALVLVPPLYGLAIVLKPIVIALNATANGFLRLFGIKARNDANTAFTLDQVEDIVEHSTREGVLNDASGAISNTFEFTDKQVQDVLVPMNKLVTVTELVTPRELEQLVAKHGFSRYPVIAADGDVAGYLHLKDVIDADDIEADQQVERKLIRSVRSIATNVELEDALSAMQRDRQHLMVNFDDLGKPVGVLFLEDILEELVGEVQDATRRI
jgi:CBS domain containing-hemolysin-like protein